MRGIKSRNREEFHCHVLYEKHEEPQQGETHNYSMDPTKDVEHLKLNTHGPWHHVARNSNRRSASLSNTDSGCPLHLYLPVFPKYSRQSARFWFLLPSWLSIALLPQKNRGRARDSPLEGGCGSKSVQNLK
jgi:hypothetical protein